jgi:hypothetical protein
MATDLFIPASRSLSAFAVKPLAVAVSRLSLFAAEHDAVLRPTTVRRGKKTSQK